jgi:hypothetical protein
VGDHANAVSDRPTMARWMVWQTRERTLGEEELRRWEARPLLGAALHAALVVVPLLLGIGVGLLVRDVLPERWALGIPPWVVAGVAGMVVVWAVQPVTRRLLPLSWLLKLGMLFPGRAPTRFKIARQAGRLQDLERRITTAATDTDEQAAQRSAELILSLVTALTAHDRRTRGHAERTRVFTDLLSEELGLPREDRDKLRWASLLHDIGKLEVSHRLLNKPGRPTTHEWQQLRRHPEAGDQLIAPLRGWLGEWADTVLHHHERWDGAGYPAGLAGEQIALGARIVAVADVYDVMTAVRSYKRPSSAAAAREELVRCSGSQFDPAVVRAFLSIPLPRLRWALGPLAWVAQLPGVRETAHVGAGVQVGAHKVAATAPGAVGAAVAATGLVAGAKMTSPPPPVTAAEGLTSETTTVRVEAVDDPDGREVLDERARHLLRSAGAHAAQAPDGDRASAGGATAGGSTTADDASGPAAQQPSSRTPGSSPRDTSGGTDAGPARNDEGSSSSGNDAGTARDDDRPETGSDGSPDPDRPDEGTGARSEPPAEEDTATAPVAAGDPTSREDCFTGGWESYGFRNQGQCVAFVETGNDSRTGDDLSEERAGQGAGEAAPGNDEDAPGDGVPAQRRPDEPTGEDDRASDARPDGHADPHDEVADQAGDVPLEELAEEPSEHAEEPAEQEEQPEGLADEPAEPAELAEDLAEEPAELAEQPLP